MRGMPISKYFASRLGGSKKVGSVIGPVHGNGRAGADAGDTAVFLEECGLAMAGGARHRSSL